MNKLFCYLLALVFTMSYADASIFDGTNYNHNLYIQRQASPKLESTSFLTLNWQFTPHKNKLAATHWLPDFQEAFKSRTNTGGGSDDVTGTCSTYNSTWLSSQPDSSKYDFISKDNVDGRGLKCYADVKCKTRFQYTSANCSGNYNLAGESCNDKYESCNCKSEFRFNASNCSGEYQLSGASCNRNYNACVAKSCSSAGYFETTQANKKCFSVTYGGRTCQSCYQPKCSEGGLDEAEKSGSICTSNIYYANTCYACSSDPCYGLSVPSQPYGCQTTYPQCPSKCQVAYPDNCRNRTAKSCDYGCQSKFGDCSSKCETCKSNPDCSVTSQTCAYGCSTTNSCDKCTTCKDNLCDTRTDNQSAMGCTKYYDDCDTKCEIPLLCKIGDIYWTERGSGVCYPPLHHYDTTPLGVVIYVTEDGMHGQVASINPLSDASGKFLTYQWGSVGDTTGQTKYEAFENLTSCKNTDNLLLDSKTHPAAIAARSYAPTSTTSGKWCLPALGVLNSWSKNKTIIDESFKILKSKQFDIINAQYWSSTGQDYVVAWYVYFNDFGCCDSLTVNDKSYVKYVRPVLEF